MEKEPLLFNGFNATISDMLHIPKLQKYLFSVTVVAQKAMEIQKKSDMTESVDDKNKTYVCAVLE